MENLHHLYMKITNETGDYVNVHFTLIKYIVSALLLKKKRGLMTQTQVVKRMQIHANDRNHNGQGSLLIRHEASFTNWLE